MPQAKLPAILRDDQRIASEEGVTFSSNPAHPYWRVVVRFKTGLRPSRETIRAADAQQALDFVCARYPFADRRHCEVIGANGKRLLPLKAAEPEPAAAELEPEQQEPKQQQLESSSALEQFSTATFNLSPPMMATIPAATAPQGMPALRPLPRDKRGKAILTDEALREASRAHRLGMTWDRIAEALDCSVRNLRGRVGSLERQQGIPSTRAGVAPEVMLAPAADDEVLEAAGQAFDVLLLNRPTANGHESMEGGLLLARGVNLAVAERLTQAIANVGGWAERRLVSGKEPVLSEVLAAQQQQPSPAIKAGADGTVRFTVEIAVRPQSS